MLEIKHLTKVYKTKGGQAVKALDDVSLFFGNTGLVFLHGKSGCGKSTLLNLIGGLDEPTSGEVIVMGKSSNEFSGSDFDSYRNTYVGFIFQEYNILNEFNVEDNIALALELQGKPKDEQLIADILEEVDLKEYAKRKPNTLSGGQKQRIAIARALIKSPQIIMADEPTGALDSATGKQVLETLKRLSKTRLVLVVSHDREFATTYGDRIIELKDGKVISDVSRCKEDQTSPPSTENGTDVITIKSGTPIEESLNAIQNFILKTDGDIIIARGSDNIASIIQLNHSDGNGATDKFEPTAPPQNEHPTKNIELIRSKLPLPRALKIGASGLKLKPFRLAVTILLSVFSFIMFGLFSTIMLYSEKAVLTQSFLKSDYEYLTILKQYEVRETYYGSDEIHTVMRKTTFTDDEIATFESGTFGAYTAHINEPQNISIDIKNAEYYVPNINKVATVSSIKDNPLLKKVRGKLPAYSSEIVVSSYFFECAKVAKFYDYSSGRMGDDTIRINTENDLIGQYIAIDNKPIKIVGIFDSGPIPAKYDSLKDPDSTDNLGTYSYGSYLSEGLHSLAIVADEFIKDFWVFVGNRQSYSNSYFDKSSNYYKLYASFDKNDSSYILFTDYVYPYTPDTGLNVKMFNNSKELKSNQIVAPFFSLSEYFKRKFYEMERAETGEEKSQEYLAEESAYREFSSLMQTVSSNDGKTTMAERTDAASKAMKYITDRLPITVNMRVGQRDKYDYDDGGEFEVVGAYIPDYDNGGQTGFFCSKEFYTATPIIEGYASRHTYTKYVPNSESSFDLAIAPLIKNKTSISKITEILDTVNPTNDVAYSMTNVLYTEVKDANNLISSLSQMFLWIGLVLALFASLMLFNFISLSINNKKKEIGILRAVGARGIDVFKIFIAESLIIVGICLALSIVGTLIVIKVLNSVLKTGGGLSVVLFVFRPLSLVLMICVALTVAFVSTVLPVYFAARKKPVESIRAL